MKRILSILSLSLVLACGSDDEGPSVVNAIEMNGEQFNVVSATITGVAISGDGHAGISFTNSNNIGGGVTLTLDVEYDGTSQIKAGTYSFPQAEGDLHLDDWLSNYSSYDGQTFKSENLEEGTLTVEHLGGDRYSMKIDVIMVDGTTFSGEYQDDFLTGYNNQN